MSLLARRMMVGAPFSPVPPPPDADYPSPVRDRALTALDSSNSPVAINYPANVANGDKLVFWIAGDTAQTFTAAGWTELDQVSSTDSFGLFWKTADGTEGGTTFSVSFTTNNRRMSAVVWAIPATGNPEASAIVTGTTNPLTVPALSPSGGEDQYLWLIAMGVNSGPAQVTVWPDGLGGWYSAGVGVSVNIVLGEMVKTGTTHGLGTITKGGVFCGIATVAVPVAVPSVVGYPQPLGLAESVWLSSLTSQTLNLPPSINAGEVLIAGVSVGDNRTPSLPGWTILGTHNQDIYVRTRIFYKTADGTEGASETVTLDAAGRGSGWVRRLSGVDVAKLEVAFNSELAPQIAFPTLTPAAGSDKVFWIVGAGVIQSIIVNSWPIPIFENPSWIAAGTAQPNVASYSQALFKEAASLAPGTVPGNNNRNVSYTIAVYPS